MRSGVWKGKGEVKENSAGNIVRDILPLCISCGEPVKVSGQVRDKITPGFWKGGEEMTCDQASLPEWGLREGRHHVFAVLSSVLGHIGRVQKKFGE